MTLASSARHLLREQAATQPARLVLQLLVLVALVGGTAGWALTSRTVALQVDGELRQVSFHGETVGDALAAAGLEVGERDLLAPSEDTEVTDATRIVLRRSRPLQLVVDGSTRTVWVTAASVGEALAQVGLRERGLAVSASRSRRIPVDGLQLQVRVPKRVSILVDGGVRSLRTTAPNVRAALMEAGVRLRPLDLMSHTRDQALTDRMVVRVTRMDGKRLVDDVPVPHRVERRPDASMLRGETKVLVDGRPGVVERVYDVHYVDGVLRSKRLVSQRQTAAPVTEVVAYGTKPRPAYSGSTGTDADGLNWGALARCESGGNPRAVSANGLYRGLYQFSMSTWRGVGGSGDPIDASPSEQTYRAKLLYQRSGRSPWPHCGRYL